MDIKKYEKWETEPFAACENPEVPCVRWLLPKIPRPTSVLDVGCGTGIHTKWFNDNGIQCRGITINHAEIAKKVHPNIGFGDMCQIPYPDQSFDLVFALGSVEHTFSPFIAIAEFNRVLRPNGFLFMDMPNVYNMEVLDPEYWYHKSVLFPIQVKDLLIKGRFKLLECSAQDNLNGVVYTSTSEAMYIAQKMDSNIRWK